MNILGSFEKEPFYLPCEYCGLDVKVEGIIPNGQMFLVAHKDCIQKLEKQIKALHLSKQNYNSYVRLTKRDL